MTIKIETIYIYIYYNSIKLSVLISVLRFDTIRSGSGRISVRRIENLRTRPNKNFRDSSVRRKSNGQRRFSVLEIFGSVFRNSSGSPRPVLSPKANTPNCTAPHAQSTAAHTSHRFPFSQISLPRFPLIFFLVCFRPFNSLN